TSLWAILMLASLNYGPASYRFPHRFSKDIDSPVLAIELATEKSDVDAIRQSQTNDPNKIRSAEQALCYNTVLDLVFIAIYTSYLFSLARLFGCGGKWALAAIIGIAIFDYIEDAFIFMTLSNASPVSVFPSLIKWGLFAVALGLI